MVGRDGTKQIAADGRLQNVERTNLVTFLTSSKLPSRTESTAGGAMMASFLAQTAHNDGCVIHFSRRTKLSDLHSLNWVFRRSISSVFFNNSAL